MNYNDPKEVAKALTEAKLAEAQRVIVIRSLMSIPDGRTLVYRWLNFCGVLLNAYCPGDPYATTFNCGQQNVEKQILADVMAAAPHDYLQMIKEQEDGPESPGGPSSDADPDSGPGEDA